MCVFLFPGCRTYSVRLSVGGRRRRFTGSRDRAVTELIEAKILRLVTLAGGGDEPTGDLRRWVENLPRFLPKLFGQLVEAGLVSRSIAAAHEPLLDLLSGVPA